MTSDAVKAKANRYLTEGRVCVLDVRTGRYDFAVAGSDSDPYRVRYLGGWRCSCPSHTEICAHIVACQKISKPEAVQQIFTDESDDLTRYLNDAFN